MPIIVGPKTTIRDVATQALKDSVGRRQDLLCLHLEPGRQLEFYPPTGAPATDSFGVKDVLVEAIAHGLADGPQAWRHMEDKNLRVFARALLESVLQHSEVTTQTQLMSLVRSTNKLRFAADPAVAADDEVRAIMDIAATIQHPEWQDGDRLVASALDDLAYFKPQMQAASLLHLDYTAAIAPGKVDPQSPAVQAHRAIMVLTEATQGGVYTQAALEEVKREFNGNVAVQYAFLEKYCAKIENNEVADQDEWTRIALHFSQFVGTDAFGTIFLPSESLQKLAEQTSRLRPKDAQAFKARMSILRKNSNRFEAYRKSALGSVPSLAGVSREFLVQMFERLNGKFRVSQSSNQQPLFEYLGLTCVAEAKVQSSVVSARARGNFSEAAAWEVQILLGELTPGDEPQKWAEVAHHFGDMRMDNARQIFAYEETVDHLEYVLRGVADGELSRNAAGMLDVLKNNARRFAAFMESDFSDLPHFDDVDRMILIPWWEVMKDALPQYKLKEDADHPKEAGSASIVIHLALAEVPEVPASEARNPESQSLPSSAVQATPTLQRPPQQSPVRSIPSESKQPRQAVQASEGTAVPAQSAAADLSRPVQRLPSANPWRKDRPPTGNERKHFEEGADHHNRGRFRWLSREARRSAREQAEARALRTHAQNPVA